MSKYEILTHKLLLGVSQRLQSDRRKREQRQAAADRRKYGRKVRQLTEQQPLDQVPGIELRGQDFHLDHAVSIRAAWEANWTPERCADISNLQMLPRAENMRKRANSYCVLDLSARMTFN